MTFTLSSLFHHFFVLCSKYVQFLPSFIQKKLLIIWKAYSAIGLQAVYFCPWFTSLQFTLQHSQFLHSILQLPFLYFTLESL